MNTGFKHGLIIAGVDTRGIDYGYITADEMTEILEGFGFTLFTKEDVDRMGIPYHEPFLVFWQDGENIAMALKISGEHDENIPDTITAVVRLNENSTLWANWKAGNI